MKFVGESGDDPAKKKIRTEDGTLLPASFKSGRYEYWKKKQKLAYEEARSDESGDENSEDNRLTAKVCLSRQSLSDILPYSFFPKVAGKL